MATVELDHISPTQLSMFFNCGEKYRRRYIEGEKIAPGIALIKGKSVHVGAEANHRHKLVEHEDLPIADMADITAESFEAGLDGEWRAEDGDDPGKSKDGAVGMIKLWGTHIAPTYQPELVEQGVKVALPGTDTVIKGVLDVADEAGIVRDLKTGARSKSQNDADTLLQLTFYSVGYRVLTDKWPSGLRLDSVTDKKCTTLETQRTEAQINAMFAKAWAMLQSVKAGIFVPRTADDGNFLCNSRFCGYADSCPFCEEK